MKRKHKTYSKPKRPFDKFRLKEEGKIKKEFGLKNKREIWKADAKIKSIREKAKNLIKASSDEQKALFERLNRIGLKVNSIADVLALEIKDFLERRLQTIVARKKLASTMKAARQMITHKKILIDGKVVNKPSFIVPVELEGKITTKKIKKKSQKKEGAQKNEVRDTPVEEDKGEVSPEEEPKKEEVPEQDKAEVKEEDKKTESEIKEVEAEAKGE